MPAKAWPKIDAGDSEWTPSDTEQIGQPNAVDRQGTPEDALGKGSLWICHWAMLDRDLGRSPSGDSCNNRGNDRFRADHNEHSAGHDNAGQSADSQMLIDPSQICGTDPKHEADSRRPANHCASSERSDETQDVADRSEKVRVAVDRRLGPSGLHFGPAQCNQSVLSRLIPRGFTLTWFVEPMHASIRSEYEGHACTAAKSPFQIFFKGYKAFSASDGWRQVSRTREHCG
jgi:hypothetical protein